MKNCFTIIGILLVAVFFGCSSLKQSNVHSKNEFDLYILAGQSNMAGRGVLTDSMKTLQNDQVWMLTKDLKWTEAKHPIHFDKPSVAGVGPGLSFGIEMAKVNPGRKIGLIPCAVGGTSIDKWQPGAFDKATSTHPYDDAAIRITEAMKHGKVKGMIWLQGESDSNEKLAAVYLEKLDILIGRIRKLTGEKKLPVVVGELGIFKPNYQLINTELHKAPSRIKRLGVVNSEGLTDKGDRTHFDAQSANRYGIRFAQEMIKIQQTVNY
jgi:hypothetical protein